ncbi:MAG: hypothetical protein AABZ60_03265 [Planctomycetota bacterium]
MSDYNSYLLLLEDRRFVGNQYNDSNESTLKIFSSQQTVSFIFILLGVACLFPPILLFFVKQQTDLVFFFMTMLFGGFSVVCFFSSYLATRLSQSILVSTVSHDLTFFLNRKLKLTLPFSQIQKTEFKKYTLGNTLFYPVSLLTQENKRVCLYEGSDLQKSRQLCELLSKQIRVPLLDASVTGQDHLRALGDLDEPAFNNLKQMPLPTDLNLSLKIVEDIGCSKLIDYNPFQRQTGGYLLFMGAILLGISFALYSAIVHSSDPESQYFYLYLIPFVLLGLASILGAIYFFGKQTLLEMDSRSLRYITKVWGFTLAREEIILSQIEDITMDETPSNFKEIKIISDHKIISLNSRQIGSVREMYYMKNFITNTILKYKPQNNE